MKVALYTGNRV